MIGIIVITHGALSEQLVKTASMIMGEPEHIIPVTFSAKESLDELRKKAEEAVAAYEKDGCIILTDLMGGSANNISVELMKNRNIEVITGANLPMVLEAIGYREFSDNLKELAARVQAGGIKSIINLKEFFEKRAIKKS